MLTTCVDLWTLLPRSFRFLSFASDMVHDKEFTVVVQLPAVAAAPYTVFWFIRPEDEKDDEAFSRPGIFSHIHISLSTKKSKRRERKPPIISNLKYKI